MDADGNILIVGAGSLGRAYASRLHSSKRQIIFYQDPRHPHLPAEFACEDQSTGAVHRLQVRSSPDLSGSECVCSTIALCVRYENLRGVIEQLARQDSLPPVAVFTPVLFPEDVTPLAPKASVAVCAPSVEALPPAGDKVVFRFKGTTQVYSASKDTRAQDLWLDLLRDAGIRTRRSRGPVEELCAFYAFGIPLLLGLDKMGYDVSRLSRRPDILHAAWSAAKEGLRAAEEKGVHPSRTIALLSRLPSFPLNHIVSILLRLLPSFSRRMLEEHFKKVREQTHIASRRLADLTPENSQMRTLLEGARSAS